MGPFGYRNRATDGNCKALGDSRSVNSKLGLDQLKCGNCGAPVLGEPTTGPIKCTHCGSVFLLVTKEQNITRQGSLSALLIKSVDTKSKLLKELQFLENQFNETQHESIPIKIENIKKRLLELDNKGKLK